MSDLATALAALAAALRHEADPAPGGHLIYTRPHETARYRYVPKMSPTGVRAQGFVRFAPDCPRPVHGVCECPPDGSWRATAGGQRPDTGVNRLHKAGDRWTEYLYVYDPDDGYWRCTRPHARAIQRLRGRRPRRFTVLMRLLDGEPPVIAWQGLGSPKDPDAAALAVIREVVRVAEQEAKSDYIRPPRKEKPRP